MSFGAAFGLVFLFYTAFTLVGLVSVRTGNIRAMRLAALCWNSRINLLHLPPAAALIQALADRQYRRAAVWAVIVNAGMAFLQFILGVLLLAPFMAGFSGIFAGYLLSTADRSSLAANALVRIPGYGAFAAAAATGMLVGVEWIFRHSGLERALLLLSPEISRGLGLTLILLAAAGLAEVSFARRGIASVPPLKAVLEKEYLDPSAPPRE